MLMNHIVDEVPSDFITHASAVFAMLMRMKLPKVPK